MNIYLGSKQASNCPVVAITRSYMQRGIAEVIGDVLVSPSKYEINNNFFSSLRRLTSGAGFRLRNPLPREMLQHSRAI